MQEWSAVDFKYELYKRLNIEKDVLVEVVDAVFDLVAELAKKEESIRFKNVGILYPRKRVVKSPFEGSFHGVTTHYKFKESREFREYMQTKGRRIE